MTIWMLKGLLLVVIVTGTGCASQYKRAWRAYVDKTPEDMFSGRWEGEWISKHNGHRGRLRAMIDHLDGNEYNARFHATYAKVLQFTHGNVFTVRPDGPAVIFNGQNDLGKLAGGMYRYSGKVDADDFVAVYRADVDHGVFTMKRVTGESTEGMTNQ